MKIREFFSPIPKEIFRKDNVRERVEIFLVLFVVAGLGYKFVKGSINAYLSLDDPNNPQFNVMNPISCNHKTHGIYSPTVGSERKTVWEI